MTFREQWLAQAATQKGFRRKRMERIANNSKAMKRAEQLAKDKYGDKAIDWAEFLPILMKLIMQIFGL